MSFPDVCLFFAPIWKNWVNNFSIGVQEEAVI